MVRAISSSGRSRVFSAWKVARAREQVRRAYDPLLDLRSFDRDQQIEDPGHIAALVCAGLTARSLASFHPVMAAVRLKTLTMAVPSDGTAGRARPRRGPGQR